MWGIVVLLALVSILDPIRVGITAILISRPRPMANLLVYWLGLMAMGLGIAIPVLLLLPDRIYPVTEAVVSATESPVVPPLQIAFGVLAVPVAAYLILRSWARRSAKVPTAVAADPLTLQATPPVGTSRFSWPALLGGRWGNSLGVAFAAGMFSATPPLEYCLVLLAIVASGAAVPTQITAILVFVVIAFAVAEIPLVSYLASPTWTRSVITRLQHWMREFRARITATALGVFGVFMFVQGFAGI